MRASEQGGMTLAGLFQKGRGREYGKHVGGTARKSFPLERRGRGVGSMLPRRIIPVDHPNTGGVSMQADLSMPMPCALSISKRPGVLQVVGHGKRFKHHANKFMLKEDSNTMPTWSFPLKKTTESQPMQKLLLLGE